MSENEMAPAGNYGVLPCLKVVVRSAPFRCCNCGFLAVAGPMVWVPEIVRLGDPRDAIIEAARRQAINGTAGGWCLRCARKLGAAQEPDALFTQKLRRPPKWWERLLGRG
jgi:hypothetical protein